MSSVLVSFYVICIIATFTALGISLVKRKSELKKRSLTLILLIHAVCLVIWLGEAAIIFLALSVVIIGAIELSRCSGMNSVKTLFMVFSSILLFILLKMNITILFLMFIPCFVILTFLLLLKIKPGKAQLQVCIYLLGLVVPCSVALSDIFDIGPNHIIAIILLVQFNDSIAYLVGKKFGKTRLVFISPISPNKTLEGYISGALGIAAAAILLHTVVPAYSTKGMFIRILILIVSVFIFANAGDLAFSSIKRRLGVKDFSNLLAGHGGVLDRFDSILCLAPVYLALLTRGMI